MLRSFESLDYLRVLAAVVVLIGVHLVEPYLSLTTSSSTTWEKLVSAFPTLYNDLLFTKPEALLDLSAPAFNFVSVERFQECLFPPELLLPTKQVIIQYKEDVCKVIGLLLPMLADGWKNQRGDMFEFGEVSSKKDPPTPH